MLSDEKLLALLRRSPEKGLDKLMNIYTGLVYTIVFNKLQNVGTREDTEECVSDVFYAFYQKVNEIDLAKGSIKAYLAVMAKRKAIDLFRKFSKPDRQTLSLDGDELPEPSGPEAGIEEKLIKEETKRLLIQEINALGEPDSEIFILKYFLGCSTRTIAEKFALKENTVDKKISRGLSKLKKGLGGVSFAGERTGTNFG